MKINMNVKRKFKINGKEYNSIEEMPADIRARFRKAMESQPTSGQGINEDWIKRYLEKSGNIMSKGIKLRRFAYVLNSLPDIF